MRVDPERARALLDLLESTLRTSGAPVPEVGATAKPLAERAIVADALAVVDRLPSLPSADDVRIYLRPGRRYTRVFWTYASSPENLGSILHFVEQATGRVLRAQSSTKVGAPTGRTLDLAGVAGVTAAEPVALEPTPSPERPETDHQRRRRERAERKAARLGRKAEGQWQSARAETEHIPMGQPILVGHHSERRHRKALERSDRKMRQAVETSEAAKAAEWSAKRAGYAISSDDPDAIPALEARLAELEASRALSKAINAAFRKGGWGAVEKVPGATAKIVTRARRTLELAPWMKLPMDLKNIGANVRRVKKRIAELEAAAERTAAPPIEGDGFTIEEDVDDNRIRFTFDARPDKETITKMKRSGFRWSRTHGAWQRQLNNAGRYAAHQMAKELFGWEPPENGVSTNEEGAARAAEEKRQSEWQARVEAEHEQTLARQEILPPGPPRGAPGPESAEERRSRASITTEDRARFPADVIEEAEALGLRPERVVELREMSRREEEEMGRKLRAAARAEEATTPTGDAALEKVAAVLEPLTFGTRAAGKRQLRYDGPLLASEDRTPDAKALRVALLELLRAARRCPTKAARNRLRQAVSAHLKVARRHANRITQRFGAGTDEVRDARTVRDLLDDARARLAEGT